MIDAILGDNVKARLLMPDGEYVKKDAVGPSLDSQEFFMEQAVKSEEEAALKKQNAPKREHVSAKAQQAAAPAPDAQPTCPSCGAPHDPAAKFCRKCGAQKARCDKTCNRRYTEQITPHVNRLKQERRFNIPNRRFCLVFYMYLILTCRLFYVLSVEAAVSDSLGDVLAVYHLRAVHVGYRSADLEYSAVSSCGQTHPVKHIL